VARSFFVTGTDTGVGKTLVSSALIRAFVSRGKKVIGMKPLASGSDRTAQGLRNSDALSLQQSANVAADYDTINPYCFEPAIAPHLAAQQANVAVELSVLQQAYRRLAERSEIVIVEGAGGWRVPLTPTGYISDFPEAERMAVILVVGLRLGCLNHALLTAEAIQAGPCRLVGWVGNLIDPDFALLQQNLDTLRERLPAPCLGVLPHVTTPDPQSLSTLLNVGVLLTE
jgi:dethiobiotin synthetase